VKKLNSSSLDNAGVQFLDRVSVLDGTGRKVFTVVNDLDAGRTGGPRHNWRKE
jgi:hypothetical protein